MAKNPEELQHIVFVCTGSDCKKAGGKKIYGAIKDEVRREKWSKDTRVIRTKCTGHCKSAPVAILMPENRWFMNSDVETTTARVTDAIRHARRHRTSE